MKLPNSWSPLQIIMQSRPSTIFSSFHHFLHVEPAFSDFSLKFANTANRIPWVTPEICYAWLTVVTPRKGMCPYTFAWSSMTFNINPEQWHLLQCCATAFFRHPGPMSINHLAASFPYMQAVLWWEILVSIIMLWPGIWLLQLQASMTRFFREQVCSFRSSLWAHTHSGTNFAG